MYSFRRSVTAFIALVIAIPLQNSAQYRNIDAAVKKFTAEITDMRHSIHQNPELGNREFKTAELVANHLKKLRMEVKTDVAHTGVVGILVGGKPGHVVCGAGRYGCTTCH